MKIEWNTCNGIATAMAYDVGGYGQGWKLVFADGHESYFPRLPEGYREVK